MDKRHVDWRQRLFALGFGEGAKGIDPKPDLVELADYMNGWEVGRQARRSAIAEYCHRFGLPRASPLRDHEADDG